MLREEENNDDRPSIQPAERGGSRPSSPSFVVYDDENDELEGGAAWRPRGRCGSGALLLMRGGSISSHSSKGEEGRAEEEEDDEVEVNLDVFDPRQEEDIEGEEEVLFVVGPTGASARDAGGAGAGGSDKARRMKTGASGTRKVIAAARHHRLGGLADGVGGARQQQLQQLQQCQQQERRRRGLLLGAVGAAAALMLVVVAVVVAGGKARHAPHSHGHGAEQPPVVQYEVTSVSAPDNDAAAIRIVGPRAPPPEPTAASSGEQTALSSQDGTDGVEVVEEEAVAGAASLAATVVDGHNNRTRALRGSGDGSARLQWPHRNSDHHLGDSNEDNPHLEIQEEKAPSRSLGLALRGWLRDAARDGRRRRRETWRSAWERVTSLLAVVVNEVEKQGERAAAVIAEPPLESSTRAAPGADMVSK